MTLQCHNELDESQITGVSIIYPIVFQAQIKENIEALRHWPVAFPHKGPVTRKIFPFDYAIMRLAIVIQWPISNSGG